MKKILFISSSRADYGLLRNVILETQKNKKETYLMVTGSHLSQRIW
jgi:UDP-N-acetylglucosamine 2-epimerase